MIKQVHNLLTVRDNLRTLKIYDKFDKISEFQNIISDRPPTASVIMTHCVQKSICDSLLT